jgi:hypothetical protein
LLERWSDPSIVPSNGAAVSRVEEHVATLLQAPDAVVLQIRFDDRSASIRDLAAYMALLDGAYGRTDPKGFRSYSLRPTEHLSLRRIASGSSVLELALAELANADIWRFLLVFLVAKTGPSVLKGEVAKNWSGAAKTLGEAALVWSDVAKRATARSQRSQAGRRQRATIRKIIQSDRLFEGLARRDLDVLVRMVEEVLLREGGHLRAAARFDDQHVIEVALRVRRESDGDVV